MSHFQIFKAGVPVTSMEGTEVRFSEADLRGIAERYDPKVHEAPLVVGHPEHDTPAYGWVRGLSFVDGALAVEEQQVDPEFDKLRQAGRYKKVSARFYTPTSKNNPTPGQYYLRDVGFLGAMPPAVKGLRSCSFGDDAGEVVSAEVAFADLPAYSGSYIAQLFRGVRDWLIGEKGQEVADRVLPDYAIQSLNDISTRAQAMPDCDDGAISYADRQPPNPNPKEKPSMKTAEQLQAELDAERAKNRALQDAEIARAASARHQEHASFADGLVAASKWPAGAKDVLVATLDHLAAPPAEGAVVSFGEGTAAKPLHQVLREQLQALPEQVSFGEFAGKGSGGTPDTGADGIAQKARDYQSEQAAKGISVNAAEAVRHVSGRA